MCTRGHDSIPATRQNPNPETVHLRDINNKQMNTKSSVHLVTSSISVASSLKFPLFASSMAHCMRCCRGMNLGFTRFCEAILSWSGTPSACNLHVNGQDRSQTICEWMCRSTSSVVAWLLPTSSDSTPSFHGVLFSLQIARSHNPHLAV